MSDWFDGQLADSIAALDAGVSVNAEDRPHGAGEIGVLKTSAVSGGQFFPNQNKTVVESERRLVAEPVQGDSILVSRMNTPALVGESCYVTEAHPSLFLPDRIWQLKPKDRAKINMRWLSFVLQSATYRRHVEAHATGTSGSMKNLPKAKLLALPVSYPAPSEQARIAQVLDTLDTAIHETEAIIAKLKAFKQGLLHDLLTRGIDANGELRPSQAEAPHLYKASPLGWVPKEWDMPLLGNVLVAIDAGWSPSCPEEPPSAGEWGVLKVSAVSSGRYNPRESKRLPSNLKPIPSIEVKAGDVLVARANGVAELVGSTVLICETPTRLMLSDKTLRLVPNKDRVIAGHLARAMSHSSTRNQINGMLNGSSGQRNISQGQIRRFCIPVPPVTEQCAGEDRSTEIENRITAESHSQRKLVALKSALMDDLLTGRVRVTPLLTAEHPQKSA